MMKRALISVILLSNLLASTASASLITLSGPTSGVLSSGIGTDYIGLTGPSFSFSGTDRGGLGYGIYSGIPIGSEVDFSNSFRGRYTDYGPFYPQLRGFIQTASGNQTALFSGSVATDVVKGYVPPGGATLIVPSTLTGTLTGCTTPLGFPGECDPSALDTYLLPVDVLGNFMMTFQFDPITNTVSYPATATAFFVVTPTPEPSSFALFAIASMLIPCGVRLRKKQVMRGV